MKDYYLDIEIEVIYLESDDVITNSPNNPTGDVETPAVDG